MTDTNRTSSGRVTSRGRRAGATGAARAFRIAVMSVTLEANRACSKVRLHGPAVVRLGSGGAADARPPAPGSAACPAGGSVPAGHPGRTPRRRAAGPVLAGAGEGAGPVARPRAGVLRPAASGG